EEGAGAVGLERIADGVGHGGEGGVVGVVGRPPRGGAVDVERRAEAARRLLEGDAVTDEDAAVAAEARRVRHADRRSGLSIAAATPERPMRPARLGKICRPFMRSPHAHTVSTLLMAPNTMRPQ